MTPDTVEIEGMVRKDGTLVLPEKLPLPAGRVRLTVQPISSMTPADQFWAGMHAIWAGQAARGHVPRKKAEINAEIKALRDEAEEEMKQAGTPIRRGTNGAVKAAFRESPS